MKDLAVIIRTRHFKMGLGVFFIYLLMCVLILIRMPYAAEAFSVSGLITVLLSFGLITWSGIKKCSQHLTMAIVFLLNIGTCAQCVISKTSGAKQSFLLIFSSALAAAVVVYKDRIRELILDQRVEIVLGAIAGACLLIMLILLIFGNEINGTKAWLKISEKLSIQLTEPVKLLSIVFFAILFSRDDLSELRKILYGAAFYALDALLLAAINELGTLMVISFVFVIMCFLFIRSNQYLTATLCCFALVLGLGYLTIWLLARSADTAVQSGAQPGVLAIQGAKIANKLGQRFQLWLKRDDIGANNLTYQSFQARDAIIVGGAFGSPLNVHVPVSESDFIFPALILRFGLLTGITVFLLFFTMYYYGTMTYLRLDDPLSRTMCAGCVICLIVQALLMIFGSTNFFIMTGIPVPYLSAGGMAQTVTFILTALLIHYSSGMEGAEIYG